MNNFDKFGTAICCIDGRVQTPVADWIRLHSQVQFVDMINEPGADKILSEGTSNLIAYVADKVEISIKVHQSKIIAVVGHYDCAANPVSFREHKEQIEFGVDMVNSWNLGVRVVGLYVNEWNSVDLICDSETEFEPLKSFL